jgi:hypothetical protein
MSAYLKTVMAESGSSIAEGPFDGVLQAALSPFLSTLERTALSPACRTDVPIEGPLRCGLEMTVGKGCAGDRLGKTLNMFGEIMRIRPKV